METIKYIIVMLFAVLFFPPLVVDAGIELPMNGTIQASVAPSAGALYFNTKFFNDFDVYNYIYKLEFLGFSKEEIPRKVWLQIYDESQKAWNGSTIEIDNFEQESAVSKEVNLSNVLGEYLGTVKYRVVADPNDAENTEFYNSTGPKIVANFRDENWTNRGDNLFNYSVFTRSLEPILDVYLYYQDKPNGVWAYYYEYQTYRNNNSEWALISWDDAPYFRRLEFRADSI